MVPHFDLSLLLDMLTYCRPARSQTVVEFCQKFIAPLDGAWQDEYLNWHVYVGTDSPVLWSCHTDTVHRIAGRQTLHYDGTVDMVQLSKRSRRIMHCLGADDTAGVFLCVSMINAGVSGHYVFHHAEEIGGIGSDNIADHTPELVNGSRFAIALDRKGTEDVITHQFGRCCSDAFAISLADQLNRVDSLAYAPDTSGVFTDTANYTGLIGECTNLSVGYSHAHSDRETLDIAHLRLLLVALCQLDQTALVLERTAGDIDEYEWQDRWTTLPTKYADVVDIRRDSPTWGSGPRYGVNDAVDGECFACGYWYVSAASDADEIDVYCCKECEHYDLHVRALEQADGKSSDDTDDPDSDVQQQSMYLSETYKAVQDALSALPGFRSRKIH